MNTIPIPEGGPRRGDQPKSVRDFGDAAFLLCTARAAVVVEARPFLTFGGRP